MFDTLYNLLIANILHGDALWLNKPSWTCKLTVDNWKFRQMDITGRRSSKRKLFKRYKRLMVVRRGNRLIDRLIYYLISCLCQSAGLWTAYYIFHSFYKESKILKMSQPLCNSTWPELYNIECHNFGRFL